MPRPPRGERPRGGTVTEPGRGTRGIREDGPRAAATGPGASGVRSRGDPPAPVPPHPRTGPGRGPPGCRPGSRAGGTRAARGGGAAPVGPVALQAAGNACPDDPGQGDRDRRGRPAGSCGADGAGRAGSHVAGSRRQWRARPARAGGHRPRAGAARLAGGRRTAAAPRGGAWGGAGAAGAGALGARCGRRTGAPVRRGSWTRRRRNATGPDCFVRKSVRTCANTLRARRPNTRPISGDGISRWPSRTPRGRSRGHGRGR
jgi:hypothetical protein